MAQAVFTKAVERILPSAIPAHLEKIDEYAVGKVLIYSKKPRKFFTTRKHELDFTGWSTQSLLAEKEELTITTARSYLFDTGKDQASKALNLNVGTDLDENVTKKLNADLKFNAGENSTVKVLTDFGKVTHISADLVNSTIRKKVKLQADHPIVQKAVENGGVMFVITDIYEAERCNVTATVCKDVKESVGAKIAVEAASESLNDQHCSTTVVSRNQATPLAYMVMKLTVDEKGIVTAQLNKRISESMKVSHPYPVPSSEIPGAVVDEKPPAQDETDDGMPDEHYLYSLKDFQPFKSTTYYGILEESRQWVAPFVTNSKLQSAFFEYTKLSGAYEKLNALSEYMLELGNTMRAGEAPPPNKLSYVDPLLSALSEDREAKMDEVTSVVIVAEAADEFPKHIVQKIFDLAPDKRTTLKSVILQTPYCADAHTYSDASPFKDSALKPIMSRLGFFLENNQSLSHKRTGGESEEDPLAAALLLLLSSDNK